MQTRFSEAQRQDPEIRASESAIRRCVHCGFCLATCPTYQILGDERDSPRGRIVLMQEMLEKGGKPDPQAVKHIDRCLSCLACTTTCPSGVDYRQLVDHARAHIEAHHRRPLAERWLRSALAAILPRPARFRTALALAPLGRPLRGVLPPRLRALLDAAPRDGATKAEIRPGSSYSAEGVERGRVALLLGCVQQALAPRINAAAVRLLTRHGYTVITPADQGCCGALPHHLGKTDPARALARANIAAIEAAGPVDAVISTASGCGSEIADYGHLLAHDGGDWPARAAAVASRHRDITLFVARLELDFTAIATPPRVAYQAACSLQHGLKDKGTPAALLKQAGFAVTEPTEAHLCCGSAGTYSILQPELAGKLRERKLDRIAQTAPDVVATGNIGCLMHLGAAADVPIVHAAELLDWATGGPRPAPIDRAAAAAK